MNINQIIIPVTDVEDGINFYELIGLTTIVEKLPDYARLECQSENQATLSLKRVEKMPVDGTGVTLYFEVNDLDERVEKLTRMGVKFDSQPDDKPWLWREAALSDPFGNSLIFYTAGENRRNPPWRMDSIATRGC